MSAPRDDLALRRLVLAVSVLRDLDVEPADDGFVLSAHPGVRVPWTLVDEVVGGHDPAGGTARRRLAQWLLLRGLVAGLGPDAGQVLRQSARAMALPADHAAHPGADWVAQEVLGGVLQGGVGLLGVLDDPLEVLPLPPSIARCAGVDTAAWWPQLEEHAHDMGRLVIQRLRREGAARQQVLRPVGGVDVPALLLSPALREHLAAGDGSGMRAVAVPMRSRGWFDLARIDPAFVGAAWSATAEHDRGLPYPVLVTADEVGAAPVSGRPLEALSDAVRDERWQRDVRYR